MQTKHCLSDLLEPVIEQLGYESVRIMTIGQANPTLQIMIDKTDGTDITVDDCAKVSRALSEVLDEKDPIADKYNLEVSSPGLDRPLTKPEHFKRFIGYEAKIETDELIEGRKRFKGFIETMEQSDVLLQSENVHYRIPYEAICKAKLVLNDDLLARWEASHPEPENIIEE